MTTGFTDLRPTASPTAADSGRSATVFGAGTRLFDGVDASRVALEPVRSEPSSRVTHLTYTVHPR